MDARRALGLGLSLFAYALWLLYDHWNKAKRERDNLRAELIYQNAGAMRERLISEEMTDGKSTN